MTKMSLKKWLIRLVPIIFYALLIVFLVLYLRSIDYSKLAHIHFNWWYFVAATAFAFAFRYWGAYIWTVLLRSLGAPDVRLSRVLIYVYAKSWLGRYIPGTAPWILGKIYFAAKQGISKNKLAVSSLLEGGLQIIVQLLFALALLAFDPRLDIIGGQTKLLIIAAAAVCVVMLIPQVFNFFIALAYKIIRHKTFEREHYATAHTVATGFSLYVIGALLTSLSFYFIAKATYPALGYDQIFFVMGVSTLASAVSMIAVFAPSGLGVREGIQLALLSLIMPTEIALVITVITRLWSVAVDFVFFLLARLAYHPTE